MRRPSFFCGSKDIMTYTFDPIGHIESTVRYPQEAPRQGVLTCHSARIVLAANRDFEEALSDLDGVERIWIVFVFHLVRGWRPKVQPPVGEGKKGVFSTRSPHRPNPIGITAARLEGIDGLTLRVSEVDLLDGTPVLDIKPYIPFADSFPDARTGWRERTPDVSPALLWSETAEKKAAFILAGGGPDIREFCHVQLGTRFPDPKKMRLGGGDPSGNRVLAFRTWRILFFAAETAVTVSDIRSGYAEEELAPGAPDPFGDKELHRAFRKTFSA